MMTMEDKARAYYKIASDAIDYLWSCADKGFVPLRHDANVFNCRLNRMRNKRVDR